VHAGRRHGDREREAPVRSGRSGRTEELGLERRRRRPRQAWQHRGRRRLPDDRPERLRGRGRHRLPGARVDVDGAGARRGVSRVRLHLQAADEPPLAVRHLHDPGGELRGPLRGGRQRSKGSMRTSSGARSTATTRAARSSATRTASSSSSSSRRRASSSAATASATARASSCTSGRR
jgi:hypothetical protein